MVVPCSGPKEAMAPGTDLRSAFSPCGQRLVSTSQTPRAPGFWSTEDLDNETASKAFADCFRKTHSSWQLLHTEVEVHAAICEKVVAVTSPVRYDMASLAWHPNPAACIYIIADVVDGIHLIDGWYHRPISFWPLPTLLGSGTYQYPFPCSPGLLMGPL